MFKSYHFLAIQIDLKMWMIATLEIILQWYDPYLSQIRLMSGHPWMGELMMRMVFTQLQIFVTCSHSKNKWFVVSSVILQRSHLEGKKKLLLFHCSYVGNLLWISRHTIQDIEGGIDLDQNQLQQTSLMPTIHLNSKSSFKDKSLVGERF